MKIKILILMIFSLTVSLKQCDKNSNKKMDIKTIKEDLIKAEKVSVFLLNPEQKPNNDEEAFCNFTIVDKIENLDTKNRKTLYKIITSNDFYTNSETVKNCTFLPDIGFRIYMEKNKTVDLLIAFYCDEWLLKIKDDEIISDFSKIRSDLLELSKNIFPSDDYLKKIPVQND